MKERKIPVRTCIACRTPHPKKELLRIVKNKEGEVSCDFVGKASGRGAYICPNIQCLEKAYKIKALGRALECEMTDVMLEELRRVILRREIGK